MTEKKPWGKNAIQCCTLPTLFKEEWGRTVDAWTCEVTFRTCLHPIPLAQAKAEKAKAAEAERKRLKKKKKRKAAAGLAADQAEVEAEAAVAKERKRNKKETSPRSSPMNDDFWSINKTGTSSQRNTDSK